MKQYYKRIMSLLLVISMSISIFFLCPVYVYADDTSHGGGGGDSNHGILTEEEKRHKKQEIVDHFEKYLLFLCAEMGTLVDDNASDFNVHLRNYIEYEKSVGVDYFLNDNISIDDDGTITFGRELIDAIKQALTEYQEERYGYKILPTVRYSTLQTSYMPNAYVFQSIKSLTQEYGVIGVYSNAAYTSIYNLAQYNDGTAGLYLDSLSLNGQWYITYFTDYLSWEDIASDYYQIPVNINHFESIKYTWEDIGSVDGVTSGTANRQHFRIYNDLSFHDAPILVSYTGSNILMFNSKIALMNYSVDKRGVFVGSKFFEDSVDITVSTEELEKSIDNLADILDDFRDSIGDMSGLTEEQLESLLDKFLDDFFDRLGNSGGGSGGGGSSGGSTDLSGIYGYLEAILDYLDGILAGIEALVWFQWEDEYEDSFSDITDMFGKINDDPETGSQEVADALAMSFKDVAVGMTKKFPFSIPWDLYGLFTVFSKTDTPKAAQINVLSSNYSVGDGARPIAIDAVDLESDTHDAPYFKLPIKVESFGIYEEVIVDMKDFQTLSTLSRTFFALIFAAALLKFTLKVLSIFGAFGGGDD